MPLLLRNIRSRKRKALITDLSNITKKELEKGMEEVKKALIKSHEIIVADWKNKPEFRARKTISSSKITVTLFPAGDNAKIWEYVDQGTEPHDIRPVKAKVLRFKLGYSPKTLANPARTVSGGGKTTGPEVRAKLVHHPGSEPRKFSETIARDIKPDFNRIIDNTFRRIARLMEE